MKSFQTSLIAALSTSVFLLGACSGNNQGNNQAANSENTSNNSTTQTAATTEATVKEEKKHDDSDGHKHTKDGKHAEESGGQIVDLGKYHVEFKPEIQKDATHLDMAVHGEKDEEITDAKLIAQVQLPDGSNKTVNIPYNAGEKQYTTVLKEAAAGEYKIVLQTDIKGQKLNGRFGFKR
jgi:hypothetical protein